MRLVSPTFSSLLCRMKATFCAISGENCRMAASRPHRIHTMLRHQAVEHLRGAARVEVREDQRDGLRMLAVEKFSQLRGSTRCNMDRLPWLASCARLNQRQQVFGPLLSERVDQQPGRVLEAPVHHELLGLQHFVELFDHLEGKVGRDIPAQLRQLLGHPLHIGLGQVLNDLLTQLVADSNHENGGFAHSGQPRSERVQAVLRGGIRRRREAGRSSGRIGWRCRRAANRAVCSWFPLRYSV